MSLDLNSLAQHRVHNLAIWELEATERISDLQLSERIPRGDWGVSFFRDHVVGGLVVQLRAKIASYPKEVRFFDPADWWQHLKQRWFPQWALTRWPVIQTERRVLARMIWPNYPTPADWGQPIQFIERVT